MASASKSRRRNPLNDPYIPAILRADAPIETRQTALLWDRWLSQGDQSSLDALTLFYTPLVGLSARLAKLRRPAFYLDQVEDLMSDGAIGLLQIIQGARARLNMKSIKRRIRTAIYRATVARNWGGIRPHQRTCIIRECRQRLVTELGHLPSEKQMIQELRRHITNGQIQIGETPRFAHFSDLQRADSRQVRSFSGDREAQPLNRMMRRELDRIARRSLSGDDLQIFRFAVAGHSQADIGRALGFTRERARQRVNGIFWQLRQRADLAAYLDVEPAEKPASAKTLPSIETAGPAPMRRVG